MKAALATVVCAVLLPVVALGAGAVLVLGGSAAGTPTSAVGAAVLVERLGWSPVLADAVARAVAGAEA